MRWHSERVFWAGIHLSATMPIKAGIKIETIPCIAKKSQIFSPRPTRARKLPIEVR